jgi:hypothetical protein
VSRGHALRQASIVSAYVRGRSASQASNSSVDAVGSAKRLTGIKAASDDHSSAPLSLAESVTPEDAADAHLIPVSPGSGVAR